MTGASSQKWFEGPALVAFEAYWGVYERHFDDISRAMLPEMVTVAPSFADPIRTPAFRGGQDIGLSVVRGALRSGDWEPLTPWLEARGSTFAKVGVSLDEWIDIVLLIQRQSVPYLVRGHDAATAGAMITAMLEFWNRAIRVARRGYALTRETLTKGGGEALMRSERLFRAIVETSADALSLAARDGTILYSSPATGAITGQAPESFVGHKVFDFVVPHELEAYRKGWQACLDQPGVRLRSEFAMRLAEGKVVHVETLRTNLLDDPDLGAVVSMVRDITEQRRIEEQLRQSQKLEAIGTLAGGIAHDFNNLLSVILSCCEVVLHDLPRNLTARADVEEIRRAGERAALLTRQLLAFSRKQMLHPRTLSLSAVVTEMTGLIRRLVGEHIDLVTLPAPGDSRVKADPSQIAQVVMNLVVNARDAMPHGGKLMIETSDAELDATRARTLGISPGPYVLLSVSDSGVGMDAGTLSRVFEPFFSTKGERGTGLGLSTAFGIVRQSGGAILPHSEPGQGSTFRVYLPRTSEVADEVVQPELDPVTLQGNECVLLVEDDDAVRRVTHQMLRRQGYQVLEASNPGEAILVAEQHKGRIDLLLTDVVLPKISGRKLAERLVAQRPELRVLYMSGHAEESIVHNGVLEPGIAFLPKPFTPDALVRKVRALLSGLAP
jgi:two-component system cell cycle sensor histidine kinase/response regulator CckA